MGPILKNPLHPVFWLLLLHSFLCGSLFLFDLYRRHSFNREPLFYISLLLSVLFLYCYARHIKYAWHIALCWLFAWFSSYIMELITYGPIRMYRPWDSKASSIVLTVVVWVMLTRYLLSRYTPYMNFIEDLTSRYDE